MSNLYRLTVLVACILLSAAAYAQTTVKGKIIDALTKEPVQGASIHCTQAGCSCGCTTNASGEFEMHCKDCRQLSVSYIGYAPQVITVSEEPQTVLLAPSVSIMNEVVVSANRD